VRAASRYLKCSYHHLKKWLKFYKSDVEEYETLFDEHLNPSGKGIPKFLKGSGKQPALIDIIEGRTNATLHSHLRKLNIDLVSEGHLKEECSNCCGFNERRVLDYKIPINITF
jgi:hypothetical protein